MEKTSTEIFFKWLEDVWTQSDKLPSVSLPEGATGAIENEADNVRRNEDLADVRLEFESFASNGDHVTCAMVVKAKSKVSGEPVAFRAKFDGKVRDGQLVGAANAVDYLLA